MNAGDYLDFTNLHVLSSLSEAVSALGNQGILFRLAQVTLAIQFAKIEPGLLLFAPKGSEVGLLLAKVVSEKAGSGPDVNQP